MGSNLFSKCQLVCNSAYMMNIHELHDFTNAVEQFFRKYGLGLWNILMRFWHIKVACDLKTHFWNMLHVINSSFQWALWLIVYSKFLKGKAHTYDGVSLCLGSCQNNDEEKWSQMFESTLKISCSSFFLLFFIYVYIFLQYWNY